MSTDEPLGIYHREEIFGEIFSVALLHYGKLDKDHQIKKLANF